MNKWISKGDACQVAEPYGAFQNADAQGDVRHQFANDTIERHERIRNAAPDLLAALVALVNHKDDLMPSRLWDAARAAIARAEGDQCD